MNNLQTRGAIKGSMADMAAGQGVTLEEAFVDADVVVMVDVSGSMDQMDDTNETRYDRACKELEKVQGAFPGRVALLGFSSYTLFHPSGIPDFQGGGTDMSSALEVAILADVPGMTFILISDGDPNDDQRCLNLAMGFQNKIDTVFIGDPNDAWHDGKDFLKRLAEATGGVAMDTVLITNELSDGITKLLEAKA